MPLSRWVRTQLAGHQITKEGFTFTNPLKPENGQSGALPF